MKSYNVWTEADDAICDAVLAESGNVETACAEIARKTGIQVTRHTLDGRLKRRGKGSAYQCLGIRRVVEPDSVPSLPDFDDEPTSPGFASHDPAPAHDTLADLDEPDVVTSAPSAQRHPKIESPPVDRSQYERLVQLARKWERKGGLTLEALCDTFEMHPAKARGFIAEAQAAGVRVEFSRETIGVPPRDESTEKVDIQLSVARAGQARRFAIVGDVHAGSKHHLGKQLRDFCDYAYHERGVRQFLQVGDLCDGNYRHSVWEQSHRGFDEQIEALAETLPQYPDAVWPFIQGNHDETLGESSGVDVGPAIVQAMAARGRHDLVYLGSRGAYARLVAPGERRGLFVHLWHPRDKGNAYAKSYRLQKQIEKYAPGTKPDLLAAGHWHQQFYFTTRGVHAMSCGCWQGGQSSFGKSLGGQPEIGSWIIEYSMTSEGAVRTIAPEWRGYQEIETVRDVALG